MKRTAEALAQVLAVLVLTLALVALIYTISRALPITFDWIEALDPATAVPLAIAVGAGGGSLISVLIQRRLSRREAVEQELRTSKLPLYDEFISFYLRVLYHHQLDEDPPSDDEQRRFFLDFTRKIILWGSDDVLRAWSRYRRNKKIHSLSNPQRDYSTLLEFEYVLAAIRRDTGHKNNRLKEGDVLGLLINDIDKWLPPTSRRLR